MRINHTSSIAVAAFAAFAAFVSACGGGGDGSTGLGGGSTPVLTSITISAPSMSVAASGTLQLTVSPKDQFGKSISANISWSSSAPTLAFVNSSGLVIGIVAGTATMTAQSGTVSASTTITVTGGGTFPASAIVTMPALSFAPAQTDIAMTGTVSFQFPAEAHNVIFTSGNGAPADIQVTTNVNVSRQFNTRGAFEYVCTLHPGMQGTVVVH